VIYTKPLFATNNDALTSSHCGILGTSAADAASGPVRVRVNFGKPPSG
jgi:hypothetical protein